MEDFSISNNLETEMRPPLLKVSNIIHLITVVILIGAALYNIWEPYKTQIYINILNKDKDDELDTDDDDSEEESKE